MTLIRDVVVILVAGGVGSRMKASIPKQFLTLKHKPVVKYSFDLFMTLPDVAEIVVVCAPDYRHLFEPHHNEVQLTFALPGERRQDSVNNGLQAIKSTASLVCVHDSARPCITIPLVKRVIEAARLHGASAAGMPVKFTIKEVNGQHFVANTPDRSFIWEIQTPQIIRKQWLQEGFAHALKHNLTVTDDVSLIELLKKPVKLVEGCYTNLKITTPEDLIFAEQLIRPLA